jgi:hypothetical protein
MFYQESLFFINEGVLKTFTDNQELGVQHS